MDTQGNVFIAQERKIELPKEIVLKEDVDNGRSAFGNNFERTPDGNRWNQTKYSDYGYVYRGNDQEINTRDSLENNEPMARAFSEPAYETERRVEPPPPTSRRAKIAKKLSDASASLPSLPLSKNIAVIKDKLSPTNIKQFTDVKADMKKMKECFHGSRKSTLPTYVAANIRRGSDVNNLVEEDDPYSDIDNDD